MLSKKIKIAASCVLACSLSYLGKASDPIIDQDDLESASSSVAQPAVTDASLVQQVSEETASSIISTDTSASSETAGKRKKVSRNRSSSANKTALSKGMQIELSDGKAALFSNLTYATKAKIQPSTSENLFAPKELLPIHLLLALLVDEIKTEMNIHSIVYIPEINMYLGFKHMQKSKIEDLKKALKFDKFREMRNVKNAITLLSVSKKEDLEKLSIPEDMEMAKQLISEAQAEQWYQTHIKLIRGIADKRMDPNTLGVVLKGQEQTQSNLAPYLLYASGEVLQPEPTIDDSSQKSKKDKKKTKHEVQPEKKWIEVMLSVTKIKEQPRKPLKREKSTASRKRSGSNGAIAASSSTIQSPSSPRVEELKTPGNSAGIAEGSTKPGLTPLSIGV